jgi:hypothetical protein
MIVGFIKKYNLMFIKQMQSAGWNFNWDWSESCQFTKYNKGQFYDWHCDSWDKPYHDTIILKIQLMAKLENYQ